MTDVAATDVVLTIEADGEVRNPINVGLQTGEYLREIVLLCQINPNTNKDYNTGGIPLPTSGTHSVLFTAAGLGINLSRIVSADVSPVRKRSTAGVWSVAPSVIGVLDAANAKLALCGVDADALTQSLIVQLDDATDLDAAFTIGNDDRLACTIRILAKEKYPS